MKNQLILAAIFLSRISSIVFSIKYSIIASKVVRPSTIFQIVASLGPETEACRVMASISRDGVAVTTNEALLSPDQSQGILLLKVPPDNRYVQCVPTSLDYLVKNSQTPHATQTT